MQGGGKSCSKAKLSPAHLNIGSDEISKRRTEGAHKGCLENPVFRIVREQPASVLALQELVASK